MRLALLILMTLTAACDDNEASQYGVYFEVQETVVPGEAPVAVLRNAGSLNVGYGCPFLVEQWTVAGWKSIKNECMFTIPLLHLGPGENYEERISVCDGDSDRILRIGTYRVSKTVLIGEDEKRFEVADTFEVRADG